MHRQRQHARAARARAPSSTPSTPTPRTSPALDVTPTRILAAVADITGRTVGEYELRTPRRRRPGRRRATCMQALDGAAASAGLDRAPTCTALAIGTPGAFDPRTRRLRYARHLPGWHDPHLLDRLADALGVPVDVDNDVNLAAVAELRVRARRGASTTSCCSGRTRAWAPRS